MNEKDDTVENGAKGERPLALFFCLLIVVNYMGYEEEYFMEYSRKFVLWDLYVDYYNPCGALNGLQ